MFLKRLRAELITLIRENPLHPRPPRSILLLLFLAGSAHTEAPPCNGHPELCGRKFNEVVYPATHNAMSNQEMHFFAPNQGPRMTKQLEDGVRCLLLDLHKDGDKSMLCHGPCSLGKQDLVEGMVEIRTFMDTHPNEVLSFLLEVYITPEEIQTAFDEAGISRYCYAHKLGEPWPTLGEMITTNKRLVVLTDREPGNVPWLLPMWKEMWDTPWDIHNASEFDCRCNRGKVENSLFAINHFISNPLPLPKNAEIANKPEILVERAKKCQQESGKLVNFLTVDHYEIGGLFAAVDELNGVNTEKK